MRKTAFITLGFTASLLSGCVAAVGVSSKKLPSDAAATCARHCQTIGMELSAVAIMAENVGCVCQAASQAKTSGASVTAGMATIALQAEAQRQRQQQQRSATQ